MNIKVTVMCAALFMATALVSESASADIQSKVQNWFDSQNYVNVTNAAVVDGQRGRYATAGGIYARVPITDTLNFINVEMPRFSAGCGGIDFYFGGFSAIDADQFIQNLKAIGDNAKSLAFMLALQIVSPQMAGKIKEINDWAQRINQFNMNSCDAAQKLVGGALEFAGQKEGNCTVRRMNDFGEDYTTANNMCTTGGAVKSTEAAGGDANETGFVKGNLAWYVLMQDPYFRTDVEFSEMVMNMTGTVVIDDADHDDDGAQKKRVLRPVFQKGAGDTAELFFIALLEGNTSTTRLKMFRCADLPVSATPTGCMNISTEMQTVNVDWEGMNTKVLNLMTSIYEKFYTDTTLTDAENGLVVSTSLPIYRYMASMAAYFPRSVQVTDILSNYSSLIAKDIVYKAIASVIERLEYRSRNLSREISGGDVQEFRDNLDKVHEMLSERMRENRENANAYAQMIERINAFEKQIASKIAPSFVRNAAWRP